MLISLNNQVSKKQLCKTYTTPFTRSSHAGLCSLHQGRRHMGETEDLCLACNTSQQTQLVALTLLQQSLEGSLKTGEMRFQEQEYFIHIDKLVAMVMFLSLHLVFNVDNHFLCYCSRLCTPWHHFSCFLHDVVQFCVWATINEHFFSCSEFLFLFCFQFFLIPVQKYRVLFLIKWDCNISIFTIVLDI